MKTYVVLKHREKRMRNELMELEDLIQTETTRFFDIGKVDVKAEHVQADSMPGGSFFR